LACTPTAVNCVYSTGELDQHSVPGRLNDPAVMLGNCWIDDLAPQGFQGRQSADLVGAHQPRVTRDISRQDRCQPSMNLLLSHGGDSNVEGSKRSLHSNG
jgi:hypothetical protein